jgi:hypothetical protein
MSLRTWAIGRSMMVRLTLGGTLLIGLALATRVAAHNVQYTSQDTYSGCVYSGQSEVRHSGFGSTFGRGKTYSNSCGAYLELFVKFYNDNGTVSGIYTDWLPAYPSYLVLRDSPYFGVWATMGEQHRISMTGPDTSPYLFTIVEH